MFNPDLVSPFPVRYEARFEHAEASEASTEYGLADAPPAPSHGLLRGELRVLTGLPPALAQGMFTTPMAYPVVMRLSSIPGDLADASGPTPRCMAIKVLGVEGARLPGSEGQVTQNFVLINSPRRAVPPRKGLMATLKSMGSGNHPDTHIVGETFYSQVPMLHGTYMAKLSVVPISPGMLLLENARLDLHDKPHGLRDAVLDFFSSHSAEWEVRVQLCTDIDTMPIEDASAVWPEEVSAYLPVARITVPPQAAWSEARSAVVDDSWSFNPWQGLAAHRPLGTIMRLRKAAQVTQEPKSLDDLPD